MLPTMNDTDLRASNLAVVRRYIDAINAWDFDTKRALLAEDAVFEMPYAPEGFERRIVGRDNIIAFVETIPAMIDAENLHDVQLETYNSDPGEIVAEYKSDMVIKPHGVEYRNEYVSRFTVRDGQIARFAEYYDPIPLVDRPRRQRAGRASRGARKLTEIHLIKRATKEPLCASASSIRRSTCPTPRTRISHSGATSSWSSCTTCSGSTRCGSASIHSGGCELIVDPLTFIAHVAPQTQRIKLGTGVISLPYHNPLWIAERMVFIDHLTRGRALYGLGVGALPTDAYMIGMDPTEMRPIFEESVDVLMHLLCSDEPLSITTERYTLRDARIMLKPYSDLQVLIAAVVSPSGPRIAGKHGLGLLSIAATMEGGADALAGHWQVVEERAAQFGAPPASRDAWTLLGPMHIAETREQAIEDVR